jgi:ribosome-binding protein aMBF1 (putative translation factor)
MPPKKGRRNRMIKIYMLNRGEDKARFLRGEAFPVQVGNETVIFQLESRLSAKKIATSEPVTMRSNGAKPKPKQKRRQYSEAFKKAMLAEIKKTGKSYHTLAKERGISPSVVLRWTKT